MGDPFSSICQESSEPELLRRSPFAEAYTLASSPASAANLGGAAPSPTPRADAPVLICCLPDSPAANDGDRALGYEKAPAPTRKEPDPVTPLPELASTSSGARKRKSRVSRARSRGCIIRSSVSPQETPIAETSKEDDAAVSMNPSLEEIEKFRNQSLETLRDASGAVPSRRKLPDSILKPPTEEGNAGRSAEEKVEARPPANPQETIPEVEDSFFPANLRDCVDMLSGNINVELGYMDVLDVAARIGIRFPNPPWWETGGWKKKKGPNRE